MNAKNFEYVATGMARIDELEWFKARMLTKQQILMFPDPDDKNGIKIGGQICDRGSRANPDDEHIKGAWEAGDEIIRHNIVDSIDTAILLIEKQITKLGVEFDHEDKHQEPEKIDKR